MSAAEVRVLLERLRGHEAWAVIRRKAAPTAGLVGGRRTEVATLLDIPLETGVPEAGRSVDRLVAVPFRQVAERGFAAIDDGAPLTVVDIEDEHEVPVADLLAALPDEAVRFADRGGFDVDDASYAEVVERIIAEEIGRGEGANLVIARHYRAVLADWDATRALSVLRRLLEQERGAYWTFCFFTGDRYLIGASPERHVSVRGVGDGVGADEGAGEGPEPGRSGRPSRPFGVSDVRMNPISGTFRVATPGATPGATTGAMTGATTGTPAQTGTLGPVASRLKPRLLDFLADEKEIYELFMVVDEELKMMCEVCHEGGQVLGPFLKPMTHLVHTEYLLAGRSERDPREILRDTMYAATVTGSPVENACRLIAEYEPEGRGYYGAALALFGRDGEGRHTMDSPILIRTADVSPDGRLEVTAGATLVRDSDPAHEVAETHAKAAGILGAFGLVDRSPVAAEGIAELARDEDVLLALNARNRRLAPFWLTDQAGSPPDPGLRGRRVVLLDGEDDFVNMLRHVLGVLGLRTEVVRHEEIDDALLDRLPDWDLVVVGPGPGDPRDDDPKMVRLRAAVDRLLEREVPFLAVCLGHQALCHRLGIPLAFKDIVFQGTQSAVEIAGRTERVGFYNTFVGRLTDAGALPGGVTVDRDPETGDVHAITGPHYRGIQFHAESILTERGHDLIHDLVRDLLLPS